LIKVLRKELVGPEWVTPSPDGTAIQSVEALQESPVQRYSAGVLFPQRQPINEADDADAAPEEAPLDAGPPPAVYPDEASTERDRDGQSEDRIRGAYDETVRLANEYFPSAIGLTFIADVPPDGLVIRARAATYESRPPTDPKTKLREWHRIPPEIPPVVLKIPDQPPSGIQEFTPVEHLRIRAIYHRRATGLWLVTVSLINMKTSSGGSMPSGADCYFQVELSVAAVSGGYVFTEYHTASRSLQDPEEAALELLYRNRRAYAAGHGCSADWGDEKDARTNWVASSTAPACKVAPVDPRTAGGDELSMFVLSGAEGRVAPEKVPDVLENLAADYESWISDQEKLVPSLPPRIRGAASSNLANCRRCLERIRGGISLLRSDNLLRQAFLLANHAILMQQHHSRRPRRGITQSWEDLPTTYAPKDGDGRWRTFQLAFILMNLRSLVPVADGTDHPDRKLVDLIWFPTGGGKTEAYLGLAACDIFYRRLRNPADAGCTVLMRYTLRLLTAQQFQRACSLICACEVVRRGDPDHLGEAPITIGLWVGESLTPIWRQDAVKALNDLANKSKQAENPFQLLKCPWCGTELDNRTNLGYRAHGKPKSVIFVCPDSRCRFSKREERLPVLVVDEDIYAAPPTLIIGTVDKFAMLAWREDSGSIFALNRGNGTSPPDLIIQDELHLISGPLGSVVGLYEGVIDLLCSSKGRQPKIIASTATIRRAPMQCLALYDRDTFQFPPQGTDISDSFFAVENATAPGRIYMGVFASASPSFVTAMVRTLSAIFQGCLTVPLPAGATDAVRDPYWTVLQYFNSLRELGHAATLVEADIPEYMWAIASRDRIPKELCRRLGQPVELTSRLSADEIPQILERLHIRYPRRSDDDERPLDTLLASNMISVGVDVDRLGLMVIVGQPKTTSEYIQASSRVGRSPKAPGLIVTMCNPGKPRDRSHYEHFRAYHSAFYKFVEPTSVTPYSIPVLERALHALLVIVSRQLDGLRSPKTLDVTASGLRRLTEHLMARCGRTESEHAPVLREKLKQLLNHWKATSPSEWGRFGKPPEARPLMYPAGSEPPAEWDDSAWATPASMRNVDVECQARVVTSYEDPN